MTYCRYCKKEKSESGTNFGCENINSCVAYRKYLYNKEYSEYSLDKVKKPEQSDVDKAIEFILNFKFLKEVGFFFMLESYYHIYCNGLPFEEAVRNLRDTNVLKVTDNFIVKFL